MLECKSAKQRKVISLYDHFKDTKKKLKIVCDWDEVIQPLEPYALWKTIGTDDRNFDAYFKLFWKKDRIEYFPFGSKTKEANEEQIKIKNFPNFYQEAPFLTIAEDLLKLIKEDKVEKLIFLSAYDKRKFPNGDERKKEIFAQTFAKFATSPGERNFVIENEEFLGSYREQENLAALRLIPFDSEEKGASKTDWIKENASDFDIVIDDNPNICREIRKWSHEKAIEKTITDLLEKQFCFLCDKEIERKDVAGFHHKNNYSLGIEQPVCSKCWKEEKWVIEKDFEKYCSLDNYVDLASKSCNWGETDIYTPHYPAVENQHDKRVLLVKNEVSELKKEDFK